MVSAKANNFVTNAAINRNRQIQADALLQTLACSFAQAGFSSVFLPALVVRQLLENLSVL